MESFVADGTWHGRHAALRGTKAAEEDGGVASLTEEHSFSLSTSFRALQETSITDSAKAGLQFPVGRIREELRQGKYAARVGPAAPVYLAAVLEYLCAKILGLADNVARGNEESRIAPHHIELAVKNDEDLNKLLGHLVDDGRVSSSIGDGDGTPRLRESYSSSIYKVLVQVNPNTDISKEGVSLMNSFINDAFQRIATEAGEIATYNHQKRTLSKTEIQNAVRTILGTGELAKQAVSEGTDAVDKFSSA